ncbi:recombinase family protein [Aduncisulcus paluster]|uniref:Recombinase family protein n=1 Tax=Aduncisulcus paluster TaxID=2918883 RepID=A0ABQ5KCK0_9EUKA|nr:recombinase family protein [Aduncisulcus paluster]
MSSTGGDTMSYTFGYIRVSSKDQNESRQLEKMRALGIEERFIFVDKASGKDFDRPQYQNMKKMIRKGDLIYIDALDRLGRDYDGIIKEWREITRGEEEADIVVLENQSLFDSRKFKSMGEMGKLMEDQFLSLLSFVAEQERKKIKKRQAEGIAIAKSKGQHLGRPKAEYPENFEAQYKLWKAGEITAVECMQATGLKKTTFYRLVKNVNMLQEKIKEINYLRQVTEQVLEKPVETLHDVMLQRYIRLQSGKTAVTELNEEGYRIISESTGNQRKLEPGDILRTIKDKSIAVDPQIRKLAKIVYDGSGSTMTMNAIMKGYAEVEEAAEQSQGLEREIRLPGCCKNNDSVAEAKNRRQAAGVEVYSRNTSGIQRIQAIQTGIQRLLKRGEIKVKKVAEVATMLGVTRNTVYKRIQQLSPGIQEHVFMQDKAKHIDDAGILMIAEAVGVSLDTIRNTSENTGDTAPNTSDTTSDTSANTTNVGGIVITEREQEQIREHIRLQEQIIEDLRKQLAAKDQEHHRQVDKQESMYRELLDDKDKQIHRMEREVENKNQQFVNFQVLLKQANEQTILLEHKLEKAEDQTGSKSIWSRFFGSGKVDQEDQDQ